MTVLSLAPLPADIVELLIRQTPDVPDFQIESDRLLLSPHVAGVTKEAVGRIINMSAANIARVLRGEEPQSLVN